MIFFYKKKLNSYCQAVISSIYILLQICSIVKDCTQSLKTIIYSACASHMHAVQCVYISINILSGLSQELFVHTVKNDVCS